MSQSFYHYKITTVHINFHVLVKNNSNVKSKYLIRNKRYHIHHKYNKCKKNVITSITNTTNVKKMFSVKFKKQKLVLYI